MKGTKQASGIAFLVLIFLCMPAAGRSQTQADRSRPQPRQQARIQAQGAQAQRDSLAMLARALQQAGTAALTTDQTDQLKSLITTFRNNQPKPSQDAAASKARNDLDNAILVGNTNSISAAATTIAGESSRIQYAQTVAEAYFAMSALAVLSTDQVAALKAKVGTSGLVSVMRSLVGPLGLFQPMGRLADPMGIGARR